MSERKFITGLDRNSLDKVRHHLYEILPDGEYLPMCDYGWNRSGGEYFSIFRGNISARGGCKICERRVDQDLPALKSGRPQKTRWL